MAVTEKNITSTGATSYTFEFEYLKTTDVKVSVNGTATTEFQVPNGAPTTVQFNSGHVPASGAAIRIYRDTNVDNLSATFYAGSAIKSQDLNDNFNQNLYVTQEAKRDAASAWQDGDETINSTETWQSDNTRIATTGAIDGRVDAKIDTALTTDIVGGDRITVTDNSPGSGQVTIKVTPSSIQSSDIADGTIVNADINASAAIAGTKISPDFGSQNIATTGTVDGRDVSADGSKLDGIETAATADQTNAEIRTAVEAATDSNVFTDADHSKLNAIEASATADQTDAEIRAAVEAASDSNVFTDADHTKLNAIEANATADQTASEIKTLYESNAQTNALTDAEKQVIDGVTSNTSELNKLDGFTGSTNDLNIVSGKSFKTSSGTLDTTSDTEIPSSKAIAAHVASSQTAIGGFVTIADEVSFPNTQPATGVVISINNAAGVVVNSSGVSTTGRRVDNTVITINGFPSSLNDETLAAGVGLVVTSTSTANTYAYHKLLAAETDVKQLSDDINDFNARYRVASSAPGSSNDAGDMYFDTSANKMKVYNGTTNAWDDVASVGSFYVNSISSSSSTGGGSATFNGSAYRFTLSNAGTSAQQHIVSVNGVIQKPNSGTSQPSEGFALSGNDIIFAAAPASGSDSFIITCGSSVSIGTPSANSVNSSHIIDGSIVDGDISNSAAIAGTKIASLDAAKITTGTLGTGRIPDHTAAKLTSGTLPAARIADDSIVEGKLDVHNAPATNKYLKYTSNGMEWSDGASEGTDVKSTGESGGTKFLREDGDGTSSWQTIDLGNLSASSLTSGTIPNARFPSTLPAVSGANLTNLPASAGEYTASASNTLTAGQVVFLDSSGNLKKPTKSISAVTPTTPAVGLIDAGRTTWDPRAAWDPINEVGITWRPSSPNNNGSSSVFYMSMFTVTSESTITIHSTNVQPSAPHNEKYMSMICVGQPSSTISRFLKVWKKSNSYSQAQCIDVNKTTGAISYVGSPCDVGWIGAGYRVYTDPHGICKCATANRYVITMYNASAGAGGIDLVDVNPSTGAVTRNGNGYQLSDKYAQQNDRNQNCFYDSSTDRIFVHWQHEDSPYRHNWQVVRVNGTTISVTGSGDFNAYFTTTTTTYDSTLDKICLVAGDNTNNRQVAIIGSLSSNGFSYSLTQVYNSNNYSSEVSGTIDAATGRFVLSYGDGTYAKIKSAPLSGNSIGTFTSTHNLPNQWWTRYSGHGGWLQLPHISRTLWLGYQYGGGYSYRRSMMYTVKVADVTSDLTTSNYLGIAKTTGSGTRTINTLGAINTNVSGLTIGETYYAQSDGTIANSADGITGSIPIGLALASNKLLLKH